MADGLTLDVNLTAGSGIAQSLNGPHRFSCWVDGSCSRALQIQEHNAMHVVWRSSCLCTVVVCTTAARGFCCFAVLCFAVSAGPGLL